MIKKLDFTKEFLNISNEEDRNDLNYVLGFFNRRIQNKINEIIDEINNLKLMHPSYNDFGGAKISFSELPGKHDKQEEFQLWQKKLEEAKELQKNIERKYNPFGSQNVVFEIDHNKIIELYEQVIEELVKDNEGLNKQIDKINCDTCRYMTAIGCNYYNEQLQQKQPDEKIQDIINYLRKSDSEEAGYYLSIREVNQLLKYFKELK